MVRCVVLQEKYMVSHFSVYNTNRPVEVLTVRVALGFGRLSAERFTVHAKVCVRRRYENELVRSVTMDENYIIS
jgi:hypothetical protein